MHSLTQKQQSHIDLRADAIHRERWHSSAVRVDRIFAGLLVVQWIAGMVAAAILSPRTWLGETSEAHVHVYAAVFLGGLISLPIAASAWFRPGQARHVIAVAQAATTALLIHLMGGRIEAHFHVFGSLAFLAFYRDWRVLLNYSALIAADHFFRGYFWPQSVFGVAAVSPWRWVEHTAWVVFEDIFLLLSCVQARKAMQVNARQQAVLENTNTLIEAKVEERTAELLRANISLAESTNQRKIADSRMAEMQAQLNQAQKLEAVGQLAAGIAHEINTPTQFLGDNARFLQESFDDLSQLLDAYQKLEREMREGHASDEVLRELEDAIEQAELEDLRVEIPQAIEQALEGVQRVSSIVQAMREFSHPANKERSPTDINQALRSTATVCRNEWRHHADLQLELDEDLPTVPCYRGELNQVFLNLIVNASQATAEKVADQDSSRGTIRIRTERLDELVRITVADDGPGVPPELEEKIFEMFFTTKEVGKGTGQGLALAHNVINNKHGGSLRLVDDELPGAAFAIELPLTVNSCAA